MFKDKMVYFYLRKISEFCSKFHELLQYLYVNKMKEPFFLDFFNNDELTPEYPSPFNAN